jgi:hypothetical protein
MKGWILTILFAAVIATGFLVEEIEAGKIATVNCNEEH